TAADSLRESLRATLRVGTILDPESIRLGSFVRSLATSSKKTEVFLRYGMSDDVLTQIGRGELDVGYYHDAARLGASPADRRRVPANRIVAETRRLRRTGRRHDRVRRSRQRPEPRPR